MRNCFQLLVIMQRQQLELIVPAGRAKNPAFFSYFETATVGFLTAAGFHCEGSRVSLAVAATSIIFVATKHVLCRDKNMLAATKNLSRQNYHESVDFRGEGGACPPPPHPHPSLGFTSQKFGFRFDFQ